ncbi:hypothetical protein [uncultured Microbacterium sp.]|uniref:hypothetical protein n=1 Tax=uncultured Microbacterium sp. TaxID=191216 RepID=UPI0025F27784|nr:hypothetical protein [uncultured Microbacterium sp.]
MGEKRLAQAHRIGIALRLNGNARTVYCEMAYTVRDDDPQPRYWRNRRDMAADTGLTETPLKRALAELVAAGCLLHMRRGSLGRTAEYGVLFPDFGTGQVDRQGCQIDRKSPAMEAQNEPAMEAQNEPAMEAQNEPAEDTTQDTTEDTKKITARHASAPGHATESQVEFYRDTFIISNRTEPSQSQVDSVRSGTVEQADWCIRRLWRIGHDEFRHYGEEIDYDLVRDSMIEDGSFELLSPRGRARLDARADHRVTDGHDQWESFSEVFGRVTT